MPELWPSTFMDAVLKANKYFAARCYIDAMFEFLKAASVAPPERVLGMLQLAWIASERHDGRRSELESWQ